LHQQEYFEAGKSDVSGNKQAERGESQVTDKGQIKSRGLSGVRNPVFDGANEPREI
jgi:hypothetical protein